MFDRLMKAGSAAAQQKAESPDALAKLARLQDEAARAVALESELAGLHRTASNWYANAVDQSVGLSELMCLMAWSNGNVRKLSGETVTISGVVEDMARTIQTIAALSGNAQNQASNARSIVETGVTRARSAGRAMTDIAESFSGLDERMQVLGSAINNIGGFAKEIEGISSQTKLLALNATIEAARAGDAGRGFGVVAAEVKALSEETSKTTDLIRGQLAQLSEVMQGMLAAMSLGGAKVRDGAVTFNEVVADMENIRSCVDVVNQEVSSITHMLGDQQQATDSIAKNLTEIARLAGQNETDSKAAIEAIKKVETTVSRQIADAANSGVSHYAVRRLRADHMLWKQQLAECLVGFASVDPRTYSSRVAPAGEFFRRIDDPAVTGLPAFRALSGMIETMGREGCKVVQHASVGDIGKAIDAYMAMDAASGEAIAKMIEIEKAVTAMA